MSAKGHHSSGLLVEGELVTVVQVYFPEYLAALEFSDEVLAPVIEAWTCRVRIIDLLTTLRWRHSRMSLGFFGLS